MHHITTKFLKDVLKSDRLRGHAKLESKFDQLLYLFKAQFSKFNSSPHMALLALEFVLNAEIYFRMIGSDTGKRIFDRHKDEFTKHFDYLEVLQKISKGETMLFLYRPRTSSRQKLSADGVIGKFISIEHFHYDNPHPRYVHDPESSLVVLKLEIGNNGIIELPITDMAYFGIAGRKLELIM